MADSGRRFSGGKNNASSDNGSREIPERCPELTEEVTEADIPVLDQPVAAVALDEHIPALEETFAAFEKTIPVLEEMAEPYAPNPDTTGDTE